MKHKYKYVVPPPEYPGRRYHGRYCYEHHFVWWQHKGTLPPVGQVVWHINGDGRDNRIENLKLRSRKPSPPMPQAKFMKIYCAWCGVELKRRSKDVRRREREGIQRSYCSRSHQMLDRRARERFALALVEDHSFGP